MEFSLLHRYLTQENLVLAIVGLFICLIVLFGIIVVWGRMWNRKWRENKPELCLLLSIIELIFLYPCILGCLGWDSLQDRVDKIRENPEEIYAEADKVTSQPMDDTNSYIGRVEKKNKERAQRVKGETEKEIEQRLLILARHLKHPGLLIPAEFYHTNNIPNPIDWKELPDDFKGYVQDIQEKIRDNNVSYETLSHYNSFKPKIQKQELGEWGAKAIRYLLIRQNLELIAIGEKGTFRQYSKNSLILGTIFLFLYLIIIPCIACADIKKRT